MKWSLLMATVPERAELRESRMLATLRPQLRDDVELIILEDTHRIDVALKKDTLLRLARGEYVSYVDDDDDVAPNYVDTIYPLLDGVDYVGYRAQIVGTTRRSYTSIHCNEWHEDAEAWYRGIIHVCPIRREIALKGTFVGFEYLVGEDRYWTNQIQQYCKTEHQVGDDIMYHYYAPGGFGNDEGRIEIERRRD